MSGPKFDQPDFGPGKRPLNARIWTMLRFSGSGVGRGAAAADRVGFRLVLGRIGPGLDSI